MKQPQSLSRGHQKLILSVSLAVNVVLIISVIIMLFINNSVSDTARINAFQSTYCTEKYDQMLQSYDKTYDAEHAAQAKNTYAMTVCLKNYKTGQPLDLSSLQKQVDDTK